jgi:hypothetical protein
MISPGGTLSGTNPLAQGEDTAMMTVSATRPALTDLGAAVRQVIGMRALWAHTAHLVADRLRARLPGPDILTPD